MSVFVRERGRRCACVAVCACVRQRVRERADLFSHLCTCALLFSTRWCVLMYICLLNVVVYARVSVYMHIQACVHTCVP